MGAERKPFGMAGDQKRRFETVRLPAKVASNQNKSRRDKRLAKYSENKSSSGYWFAIAVSVAFVDISPR
jgi:hypothetical protein